MKIRIARHSLFLFAALFLSPLFQIRADTVFVGWDSDTGFSPDTVTIHPGDTVVWMDNDPDFPTQVTSDNSFGQPNYFQFDLVNQDDTAEVAFNSIGTIGYSDNYGHTGSIIISNSSPVSIIVDSPRLSDGKFLFDATGLEAGKTNVLEISTNLTLWTSIQTNVADNSSITFTNTVIAGSHFFRLLELP